MRRKKKIRRQVVKKTKKRKKTKKLWGLETRTFSRSTRQFMDQDYIADLPDAEKEWLSNFNESYYGNKFPAKSKKGRKTNPFDKAGIPRTEIYSQTNARNRDVHTKFFKINADAGHVTEGGSKQDNSIFDKERESIEEELIDYVDYNRFLQQFLDAGFSHKEAILEANKTLAEAKNKPLKPRF